MDELLPICVEPDDQRHHNHVGFRAVENGRGSAREHGRRRGHTVAILDRTDPSVRERAPH